MADDALEARVRLLEDERLIIDTLYQYGHSLDYGPEEEFLDVFTEDGRWVRVESKRHPERRFEGREGFVNQFRSNTHAPEAFHKHVIVNPHIEIDGDSARVHGAISSMFMNTLKDR